MDRKQIIAQRTREYFGDRLNDVLNMVQQDRQALRGWEEPAHLRAVIRRAIHEGAAEPAEEEAAVTVLECCRGAGEPDRGQQREAIGHLLESGSAGLEKAARNQVAEMTTEETLGLECVLLLYARPALFVQEGRMGSVPAFWNTLEDQREDIELVQRGVGRIELLGHPEFDWAGTGFLVNDTCLMTTRRTVEIFAERGDGDQWQFRPGNSAWMNYRSQHQRVATAQYRIRSIRGVHERYDLALLDVEPPQPMNGAPAPLVLAAEPPPNLENRPVYMIGYPVRDARRSEPEPITRIFRDVYNVKRVQPGTIRGVMPFREIHLLQHDCAMLGNSAGSPIIDLETHQVLGMHVSGRYLETGSAIPLWTLRDDPLLRQHGICFAGASCDELKQVQDQVERLARSCLWTEARTAISSLYERAYGNAAARGS